MRLIDAAVPGCATEHERFENPQNSVVKLRDNSGRNAQKPYYMRDRPRSSGRRGRRFESSHSDQLSH